MFATSGSKLQLWTSQRSDPLHEFTFGNIDSLTNVRFNCVEQSLLAAVGSERQILLFDVRTKLPLRKLVQKTATNSICWSPQEAFTFSTANENGHCYTFDTRYLSSAMCIHEDHQSAVMSIDYSPTGREFVTGSYDRTIRIFKPDSGHSHEIYHTKRMQRFVLLFPHYFGLSHAVLVFRSVFSVKYTSDARFIISGSDDFAMRIWKAHASERLAPSSRREREHLSYQEALKDKYKFAPEIRRITRHRQTPKHIKKSLEIEHVQRESRATKDERIRKHMRGNVDNVSVKKRVVLRETA